MDQYHQLLTAARFVVATVSPGGGDPAASINQAITQVSAQGGGTVLLTAGEYDLNRPLELKTGVRLVGEGGLLSDDTPRDGYPVVVRAAVSLSALVEAINADGARLEHMTLDGAGRTADVLKTASYALRVRDCVMKGETRRCVWVTSGKPLGHDMYVQATFINCLFDQGGTGIGIEGANDTRRRPTATPAEIHRGAFTDGVVYRCRFEHVGETSAVISGGWQYFENRVRGAARVGGVVIYGGATTVTDNDIETSAGPAMAIKLGNVAVTGNRLVCHAPGDVITVDPGIRAVTISRNQWSGAGGYFVDFSGPVIDRDCAVFGNRGAGEPAANLAQDAVRFYCADNTAEPAPSGALHPLPRRPAPPPIRAIVSESGPTVTAMDLSGATLASGTDAADVINAAITHVAHDGPGAVLVGYGTFTCGKAIRVLPGIVLAGEGGMSRVPVGFQAMGTVLKAGPGDDQVVVDLLDADRGGLDEVAVDGSLVAGACVRLAGHAAWIDNCFVERARRYAIEATNGSRASPDAYSGMMVEDVLVHAGANTTGLAVRSDPAAGGSAPSDGTVADARLRLGFTQADFAGGSGWSVVGNHGTSNGHSDIGCKLDADAMYVAGNYFDTTHGSRVAIGGRGIDFLGNHFQSTPSVEAPTVIVASSARDLSVESSTWHPPPRQRSRDSYFLRFAPGAIPGARIIGNVGEGANQIVDPAPQEGSAEIAGNFVAPPLASARFDAGK